MKERFINGRQHIEQYLVCALVFEITSQARVTLRIQFAKWKIYARDPIDTRNDCMSVYSIDEEGGIFVLDISVMSLLYFNLREPFVCTTLSMAHPWQLVSAIVITKDRFS